jgi:hypothetical protein
MRQGTQRASRDSSHAYMLDAVQLLDNTRSKRLLRFILGRCLLTIIPEILFQNKGFVQNITHRTYLGISSGQKVYWRGNFGCFFGMIFV